MTRDVKKEVGRPDNSAFIRKFIIYGIILAVMLFAAPTIFSKIMVPMAAKGIKGAWYAVFVPIAVAMMAIGLFRAWRRRWPLGYMNNYRRQARDNGYETCPRCGAAIEIRTRRVSYRAKVGERHITTTYSDGSKSTRVEDITENRTRTEEYYVCSNGSCGLEPDRRYSQSHLPWKTKEIRTLVNAEGHARSAKSAKEILLSRLLLPILAAVIVAACAVSVYSYANAHDGEWTYTTADKESSRSEDAYRDYLLSLDTEYAGWHVTYEKSPTDMMSYLGGIFGQDKAVSYTLGCYTFEGRTALEYRFEGDDAGTGIPDGWYTLGELDGISVLIDDTNEKIYKQGTEFYDTYAPKLLELSHDKALSAVLDLTSGGEHALSGTNDFWMEFVRKDDTMVYSYMLSDDVTKVSGGVFCAVTLYPEKQKMDKWSFSYDESEFDPLEDLEGYVYSDAAPVDEDDELGKLIEKSFDDSGSVAFFKNDEIVFGVSVDYFPNGYDFEIEVAKEGYTRGFEEGMVYRVNTTDKTLTKYADDHGDLVDGTDMPLSEHQDKYDFLLELEPQAYIRRIIDLDKAEKRKESVGLVTVYEMKDENGNVTADLKKMFGVIGEAVHYTAEDEYVMIELEH
ncbi:MAG: hypothetical protein E7647_03985 [Ruminococcaceae bacterium]|nr:hypothetical protein [Oscillospiraceae bacterium]